jgi:crotonobetainyl-CoA:carnitine CoA-transferase CaiB-like acyl-CoA transferase
MESALKDVRIVDLTQHLAGPFCTMLLADMGAEVLKIEPPWGDATRNSPQYPSIKGQNIYFMFVNRNKKSIVLDLKSEKGVEVLKKLVKSSDIVVENFRPGVMDRLGIGYDALKKVNPGIVYASISGFGQEGPYVKRPSFDIIAQAMSGWMWLNSRERRGMNSQPTFEPSCIAGSPGDTIPGTFAALSILAALLNKRVTGKGQRIDIAQIDPLMTVSGLALIRYLYSDGTAEERARKINPHIHGVYEAKDGYVVIRVIGDRTLQSVADVIGVDSSEINTESDTLRSWIKERNRDLIVELLADKVPCAPVISDEELVIDPNVIEREMIIEKPHPLGFTYRSIATGVKFSETPVKIEKLPPLLGADTIDVLIWLGYNEKDINQMIEEGVAHTDGT